MVVIVTKNKDGNVVTTVEQLEEWLKKAENEAYIRGYSAGMRDAYRPSWYEKTTTTPTWTITTPDIKITCDNKHPDDALDALRFATNIDIQANINANEECKILGNAINDIAKKEQ